MHGLPESIPRDGGEAFTGLVCPDCSGNIVVSAHEAHLSFSCRVGHTYALAEITMAKEAALETVLWRAVFSFEELAALLADLDRQGFADTFGVEICRARSELAREQASRLRTIIETDRPLTERRREHGEIGSSPP